MDIYVYMCVCVCVCVCECVKDISQTFNSEYVGVNCKLVGERESRKPSVFNLHTL